MSEKARRARTLRDLPNYSDPQDERATNPVIRLTQRATALPPPLPPEDSGPDQSLEALALLARRSSPPPRAQVHHLVAPVAAPSVRPAAVRAATPSSIPAMTVGHSSAPPHATTAPPRRRASDKGARARGIGNIVLSATVGAVVALGMWTVRSGLDRVARNGNPPPAAAALATATGQPSDKCPSPAAAPVAASTAVSSTSGSANATVLATSTAESEPRPVSFDALPVAQGTATTTVAASRTTSRRSAATTRAALVAASSDASEAEARPVARRAPSAPASPRDAVAQAIQRASFAAHSCESGPQSGKVEVTFSPTGAVSSVNLIKGYDDAGVNGCVLRAFGRVRIGAFDGDPITVRKTVSW